MKRIVLRVVAAVLIAGLFGHCDTSDCGDCREAYKRCLRSCAGFEDCERCEDGYDACLETCGTSNVEIRCEDYDPGNLAG